MGEEEEPPAAPEPAQAISPSPAVAPPAVATARAPLTLGSALARAWRAYRTRIPALSSAAVPVLLTSVASVAPLVLHGTLSEAFADALLSLSVLEHVWVGVVGLAASLFNMRLLAACLSAVRDEPRRPGGSGWSFPLFASFLVTSQIFDLLCSLGLLLFVVPGLVLIAALSLAPLLALDRGLTPVAALVASWELTRGARLTMLLVLLLQVALFVAGLLALVVGLLYTLPLALGLVVVCYEHLASQRLVAGERAAAEGVQGQALAPTPATRGQDVADADRPDRGAVALTPEAHQVGVVRDAESLPALAGEVVAGASDLGPPTPQPRELAPRAPLRATATPIPTWHWLLGVGAVFALGATPELDTLEWLRPELEQALGPVEPRLLAIGAFSLAALPVVTLGVLAFAWHTRRRSSLVDAEGLLLDHGPRWRGERLAWRQLLGYRVRADGVALVIARRPWSRVWGQLVPLTSEDVSRFVQVLDEQGVRRLD